MSARNLTAEVQIYDAPAETIIFWHINMFCVLLETNAQMPNPEQGQICTETSSDVLDLPRTFAYSIFDPERDTGSLTWSLRARTSHTSGTSLRHDRQRIKSCEFSRQGDGDSVLGH